MSDVKEALKDSTAVPHPQPPLVPPDMIRKAEELLAEVKVGRISSFAAITVSPRGEIKWPGFGMQIGEMFLGASLFQDQLKNIIMNAAKSGIIRPG